MVNFTLDNAIALLALLVSGWAFYRTHLTNKEMISLQRASADLAKAQKAELEREAADRESIKIGVYWYNAANNSSRVMVENMGLVPAFDVHFTFEPRPGYESPEVKGEIDEFFPIAEMGPGDSVNFLIAPCDDTGDKWPAVISWRNGANEKACRRIVLGPKTA